jgi:hypothetical protein
MQLTLEAKLVALRLFKLVLALVVLNCIGLYVYFYGPRDEFIDLIYLFDLDTEGNIPTLYSAFAIFFSASLLWVIAQLPRRERDGNRRYWLGLSFLMAFLALDEGARIHENLSDILEDYIEAEGFLYFLWVIPYGLAVLAIGAYFLRFVLALPAQTRKLFIASGVIFLSGAIGIEVFGARAADLYGTTSFTYCVLYTFEEFFEMTGIVLFIYGLLTHIAWEGEALSFTILAPENSRPKSGDPGASQPSAGSKIEP